jgi:hypothetical protein
VRLHPKVRAAFWVGSLSASHGVANDRKKNGRWLSALRAREFLENCPKANRQNRQNPFEGGFVGVSVPVLSISQNLLADDWQAYFDERAGIREFDGEMPRDEAEALALQDTIAALGPRPLSNTRGLP